MKPENDIGQRISPDCLLAMIGPSPADNLEGYDTAILWRSEVVAQMAKGLFAWRNFLDSIGGYPFLFGPMAIAAGMQKSMLETFIFNPAKVTARVLAGNGQGPDIFVVSKKLLAQYLEIVSEFLSGEPQGENETI